MQGCPTLHPHINHNGATQASHTKVSESRAQSSQVGIGPWHSAPSEDKYPEQTVVRVKKQPRGPSSQTVRRFAQLTTLKQSDRPHTCSMLLMRSADDVDLGRMAYLASTSPALGCPTKWRKYSFSKWAAERAPKGAPKGHKRIEMVTSHLQHVGHEGLRRRAARSVDDKGDDSWEG